MPSFSVIIPAAGVSQRFGGAANKQNKLFQMLGGKTVLGRAVDPFLSRNDVAEIMVVCSDETAVRQALSSDGARISFCPGGPTRAHSVLCGIRALSRPVDYVAIHDAARPLLSQALTDQTLAAAEAHGAAAPALAMHLTIKEAQGPLPAPVRRTLPRQMLWALQTPQIIRRSALLQAFETCPIPLDQVTDDLQLIELAGGEVWLVNGDQQNIKITTPIDLAAARAMFGLVQE